jgi:hypothetical protein
MGDSLPQYYRNANEPKDGVYRLKMLAGFQPDANDDPEVRHVLYVCESVDGGLNEAFSTEQLAQGDWYVDYEFEEHP